MVELHFLLYWTFLFSLVAKDAFLGIEFVSLTACPVGCLKSSEKNGDKEIKAGKQHGSGAAGPSLKAKNFRELQSYLRVPRLHPLGTKRCHSLLKCLAHMSDLHIINKILTSKWYCIHSGFLSFIIM